MPAKITKPSFQRPRKTGVAVCANPSGHTATTPPNIEANLLQKGFLSNGNSPLPLFSKRLITLWDMISFYVFDLIISLEWLNMIEYQASLEVAAHKNEATRVDSECKERALGQLNAIQPLYKKLGMSEAVKLCNRLECKLAKPDGIYWSVLESEIEGIKSRVSEDCISMVFVPIPNDQKDNFDKFDLFGASVNDAFPSASEDIMAAGNCLAIGLDTASVFHSMRIVEFGLRGLARSLGVTIPRKPLEMAGWDEIIQKIDDRIGQKLNRKAPLSSSIPTPRKRNFQKKERDREFFRGVIHEFYGFKDVWRNHVMHTRKSYKSKEASSVLERVRDFMTRLAEKVSEAK